jgi:hypothetical protein
MPTVRIEHNVSNFDQWKRAFDGDPVGRKTLGVRRFQVLRAQDDLNFVMIDLDFDSVGEAEVFLRAMEKIWTGPGKAVMQNPRARVVNVVETKEL